MNQHRFVYEWNEGQFVIIDNSVTYHSREPFVGRRTVYASIADGKKQPELN